MDFKEKLAAAVAEPSPPQKLVDDTVARVQTLLRGREAEKRLTGDRELTASEKASLAADGILGRLAGSGTLPLGANTAKLKQQLLKNERFQDLAQRRGAAVVDELKDGTLLKKKTGEMKKPAAKTKKGPALGK